MSQQQAEAFLSESEVGTLTGARGGSPGKTKYQRQTEWLQSNGVPHFVNIAGRPIVPRSAIENPSQRRQPVKKWQPSAVAR